MKKLRTMTQAAKEIKEKDKNTTLTFQMIKWLVENGIIPYVQIGKRKMVTMEDIEDYVSGREAQQRKR